MSVRQPRITEPAVISVYEDWRDLAERIGEDYFRTGDPSMLFAIFQGCQKDPKYKKGMWKIYQRAERKFDKQVALSFIRLDLPTFIKGNEFFEWKHALVLKLINALFEDEKKVDRRARSSARVARASRLKSLTKEEILSVFSNPRRSRNATTAARYLECDRKTLKARASALGIPLPWERDKSV